MRCEHYFEPGACVVPDCENWDRLPEPKPARPRFSSAYHHSDKFQKHRERLRQERVVCVLGER